ncbi:TIGR02646 family protein [Shewanella sp. 202IG2-18]|uniref:retron system putative HNH endonuclease n=1 Tax=Parashewanella hymeniacidonis TaxID=2807618 RepID=UPI001960FD34|nr:retron system putative HNH endonuclease [Parashewanella hymeniacidonis]MBM7072431.1 TIGR02646 family protein [Parashewanella hymeniacidonis]
MRKIIKNATYEPQALTDWKRANPHGRYGDVTEIERQAMRQSCAEQQHYLCAYCTQAISGTSSDTMNEHVAAQRISPNRTLDFSNIVASCRTAKQCDDSHGSQPLPLTPLMDECETELKFKLSGRVEGLTDRAKETIRVLNLGDHEKHNRSLIEKRKQLVSSLLFINGIDASKGLEDDELIEMVINDISTPENGKLAAFSPVAVNVLKQWIST